MSAVEAAFCRSAPWRSAARRLVLPWMLDGLPLAGDVLEIGAGSGAMAAGLAGWYPDVRLTVCDLDPAMVATARRRLAGYRNVRVEVADVAALPFAAGTFDAVTSNLMLHHVIAWRAALAECCRVLKPGGTLVGYDLTDTRLARTIHRADRSPHRLLRADELAEALHTEGFAGVTVRSTVAGQLMRFHAHKPAR